MGKIVTQVSVLNLRYGVRDVFEPEDLTELKNIPKVTKCVEELAKLVSRLTRYESFTKKTNKIRTKKSNKNILDVLYNTIKVT